MLRGSLNSGNGRNTRFGVFFPFKGCFFSLKGSWVDGLSSYLSVFYLGMVMFKDAYQGRLSRAGIKDAYLGRVSGTLIEGGYQGHLSRACIKAFSTSTSHRRLLKGGYSGK